MTNSLIKIQTNEIGILIMKFKLEFSPQSNRNIKTKIPSFCMSSRCVQFGCGIFCVGKSNRFHWHQWMEIREVFPRFKSISSREMMHSRWNERHANILSLDVLVSVCVRLSLCANGLIHNRYFNVIQALKHNCVQATCTNALKIAFISKPISVRLDLDGT